MAKFSYNPKLFETKWQNYWEENKTFRTPNDPQTLNSKHKAYILDMFPYPSGEGLHVGHPKSYTASDVITRMRRMQGYNVLHAMGWDAFGLPAERAADRVGTHPAIITKRNIDNFRRQMKRLGFSYDWDREINTSSPDYYKWTQWIFLKLYERGLAYVADVPVNWCAALGTVLANEEVQDGKYIETGDPVERRLMRQWMLKITAYAERLLEDLDPIDWPESLKEMQRNWIGKSSGANVQFQIQPSDLSFSVFTTRPDTLFGVTYCVLAPEHPLVAKITTEAQTRLVQAYVQKARNQSELSRLASVGEKTGVFTGAYAINPVNQQAVPIWIADYILMSYGTGAIMGVPAHDQRDYDFARKYKLPIIEVVQSSTATPQEGLFEEEGISVNSGFLNGLPTKEAKQRITEWLEQTNNGYGEVQYRLRDWLFSRQRYWGEPFPIVYLEDGTVITIRENDLPVELPPELIPNKAAPEGAPPLARASDEWLMVTLPDGRVGVRETNTMPQWAGSCWYYLRYIDPHNSHEAWHPKLEQYWMPVDIYIGGVEHAVLHLLYARFWHKVLYDCGVVSTKEPFQKLFNQGMVLASSYQDEKGKYYYPSQVEERQGQWFVKETGQPVHTQMEKMSKSRLNVFSLDEVVDNYGADALRLYELFIGPLSASGPWLMNGIEGVFRFLQRVWRLVIDEETGNLNQKLTDAPPESEPELNRLLHKTIKQVTEDIQAIDKMNTAISKLMVFSNAAIQAKTLPKFIVLDFLRLLSPMAPHISSELWERLDQTNVLDLDSWPVYRKELVADEYVSIPVQLNGKMRILLEVSVGISKEELEKKALSDERVAKAIGQSSIKKVIVVPGKFINFVY